MGRYGQPMYAAAQDRFAFVTVDCPGKTRVVKWKVGGGNGTKAKARIKRKAETQYGCPVRVGNLFYVTR